MSKLYKDIKYLGGELSIGYTVKRKPSERQRLSTGYEMSVAFRGMYDDTIYCYEKGWAAMLDNNARLLGMIECGNGTNTCCLFNTIKICQAAILCNATMVAICHNHPSGSLIPSNLDNKFTSELASALKVVGMRLLDHVIIEPEGDYYSYYENGKM